MAGGEAALFDFLDDYGTVTSVAGNTVTGTFGGTVNADFDDEIVPGACSIFALISDRDCSPPASVNFTLALDLFYDDGTTAPIPLPAGLPLLVAGLGGLAVFRKRRAS